MRLTASVVGLMGVAALAACTARPPLMIHEPVGPQRADSSPTVMQGALIVYSATRVSEYAQSEYPVHTPYAIYTQAKQVVKEVENTAGSFNQDPEQVSLPPGQYRVKALAVGIGEVIVPVVIEEGETTVVDLDGTAARQEQSSKTNWVRLPDGHVVGRRASCNTSDCR